MPRKQENIYDQHVKHTCHLGTKIQETRDLYLGVPRGQFLISIWILPIISESKKLFKGAVTDTDHTSSVFLEQTIN